MGAIQQAVNQTIGTAAVGAHAAKRGLGISSANDGEKNKQMSEKSRKNLQAMIQAKVNIRKIRNDNSLTDRQKSIKINKEINKLGGNE